MLLDVFSNTFVATHAVRHVVPSRYLVPVHEEHSVLRGPSQFSHSAWQGSHVFVDVFSYFPVGHTVRQLVASKCLAPEQLKQLLFPAALHVSHSRWQVSQVFVTAF